MSDASLVTSVPVIPIAIPISAALIAGASLTPSPVIATTCPRDFHASLCAVCAPLSRARRRDILNLRGKHHHPTFFPILHQTMLGAFQSTAQDARQWRKQSLDDRGDHYRRMPALRQFWTATLASSRGGSIMPTLRDENQIGF